MKREPAGAWDALAQAQIQGHAATKAAYDRLEPDERERWLVAYADRLRSAHARNGHQPATLPAQTSMREAVGGSPRKPPTPKQQQILDIIREKGPLTMAQVGGIYGDQNIFHLVRPLLENGYVRRTGAKRPQTYHYVAQEDHARGDGRPP